METTLPPENEATLATFLVGAPLLALRKVAATINIDEHRRPMIAFPILSLYCAQPTCAGIRFFDPDGNVTLHNYKLNSWSDHDINYSCRNCQRSRKTFALRLRLASVPAKEIELTKYGEIPAVGDPHPNLVADVLDDEIAYFDRGYRAEMAGLGIGAFAYYRRFVDSHKDKLIAKIREVAVAQGATLELIATLDQAAAMGSFDKAVKIVKDAIPDSLRYSGGHNPLTLLHRALSGGMHNDDDAECLELAKDIRLLLTDLAERTTNALKNKDELGEAIKRLLSKGVKPAN